MFKYFGLASRYPVLQILGEIYYYSVIAAAFIVFAIFASRKLYFPLGYSKKRVFVFTGIFISGIGPVVYAGSRAAGMLNRPFEHWCVDLLVENIVSGSSHTFHGGMILAVIFLVVLSCLFRFRISEILDTVFLYLPLVHVLGRTGCLLVGCCWGARVNLYFYGFHLGLQNPVPLYAIMVNLAVFFFLRRVYNRVYSGPEIRTRFRGVVFTAYLLLYPPARIVLEVFRTEAGVFFGLSQAQVVMGLLFFTGLVLSMVIAWPCRKTKSLSSAETAPVKNEARAELLRLFSMAALLVSLVLLNFFIYYLTRQLRIWPWPIQPVFSLSDAYGRIFWYSPVILIPACCLFWLRWLRIPINPWLGWNRFSYTFFIGLAVSIYYCFELFVLKGFCFRGPAFWPPVLAMSLMNAAGEEVIYRLALYNLIKRAPYPIWTANTVQALAYALIHFMIAGAVFGFLSFVYGLVLGIIAERNKSIIPAFICHFIIDLGVIGMPLLLCFPTGS
ncbi:membrane protease YdiL (CAAX protease family) [Desulfosalsimonas propionicica]|uniref:Membrane protease YdiL (CAAX protease family) n=1 Tax=Desulfosalsimonas propionicica TaxID=332175 RepID=A0A7W0C7M1_9BACT|nr:prolipoprotein diacylglyceryl transferase family protein [Desulfosalsimonas propionicica]MBA2880555.1 membrane protease YdiL (CAAX protease family) [Desulfosalsimonas propionicica]